MRIYSYFVFVVKFVNNFVFLAKELLLIAILAIIKNENRFIIVIVRTIHFWSHAENIEKISWERNFRNKKQKKEILIICRHRATVLNKSIS